MRPASFRAAPILAALALATASRVLPAQSVHWSVDPRGAAVLRVDGVFRDWEGVSELRAAPDGSEGDGTLQAAFAIDRENLFVAVAVQDDHVVAQGRTTDGVVLRFAPLVDATGAGVWSTLVLVPGVPGQQAGAVNGTWSFPRTGARPPTWMRRERGGPQGDRVQYGAVLREATLVDGPSREDGFTVEARIPLRFLPSLAADPGLWRLSVGYRDADPGETSPNAASPGLSNGAALPETQQAMDRAPDAMLADFRRMTGTVDATPSCDGWRDLGGGRGPLRVLCVGRYLIVAGPGLNHGAGGFTYLELGGTPAWDSLTWTDLTSDGLVDAVLLWSVTDGDGLRRRVAGVYTVDAAGAWQKLLEQEVSRERPPVSLSADLTVDPRGGRLLLRFPAQMPASSALDLAARDGIQPLWWPSRPREAVNFVWSSPGERFDRLPAR